MPSDPNPIQAQIEETLVMDQGFFMPAQRRKYFSYARKMLPRYARALEEAIRQHRDELRCSDPTCACRGMCGELDVQMASILNILNGGSEGSDETDSQHSA